MIFHDLQDAAWPEDHEPRITQGMESALNNFH